MSENDTPVTHTLSVLVLNEPGVLARVAALFARRGFNIESLAVGPTEHADISRITLVANVDQVNLEQLTKQLNKLVEVIKIVELDPGSVRRELLLVKVRATAEIRSQVLEIVQLFRAKTVDASTDAITIEATGGPRQDRGAAADAGTLRHQGTGPVRHGGGGGAGALAPSPTAPAVRTSLEPDADASPPVPHHSFILKEFHPWLLNCSTIPMPTSR